MEWNHFDEEVLFSCSKEEICWSISEDLKTHEIVTS